MNYSILHSYPNENLAGFHGLTLYHRREWHQVLEKSFGWRIHYLVTYNEDGDLASFLPFVHKRRLAKMVNVSLPLSHHIGLAYHPERFESSITPKLSLEIHAKVDWQNSVYRSDYVITRLNLGLYKDGNALFNAFNKSSIQRKIKRAEASDLHVSTIVNSKNLDAFSHLQALTRHRQGTPNFPQNFFHEMARNLQDDFKLYLVYLGEKAVAGIIFLIDGETAIYGYGASISDEEILRLGVNQLAMWLAIKASYEAGLKTVDFGLSPVHHSSLREYKEKWAGVSEAIYYTFLSSSPAVERNSRGVQLASRLLKATPFFIFSHFSSLLMREVV